MSKSHRGFESLPLRQKIRLKWLNIERNEKSLPHTDRMVLQDTNKHQAYDTHFNYIKCLCVLTRGTTLQYTRPLRKANLPDIDKKKNLIALTLKSLNDERKIVDIDKDYSYASTSWLPIKSYYLIFNILLTIEYIFKIQKRTFQLGHTNCIDEFTRKLKSQEIQFSNKILNQVFDQSILTYRVTSGANLNPRTPEDIMYKMAIRKIAKYKSEGWKQKNCINQKKSIDRKRYQTYLNNFSVSIFDFPYYMRIRSNYRDFAFIDGITTNETANYFKEFFNFTAYFVKMLKKLKIDLINLRT